VTSIGNCTKSSQQIQPQENFLLNDCINLLCCSLPCVYVRLIHLFSFKMQLLFVKLLLRKLNNSDGVSTMTVVVMSRGLKEKWYSSLKKKIIDAAVNLLH